MAPLCQHKMTLFSGSMQGFLFLYVFSFILFSLQDSLLDEAGLSITITIQHHVVPLLKLHA